VRRSATAASPRYRGGPVGVVGNVLNREFAPEAPSSVWVTDITYIRTYEGWLFLAAVMDLYSRQIVGWATGATMTTDLGLQALVAAVWRRKPGPGCWFIPIRAANSRAAIGSRS